MLKDDIRSVQSHYPQVFFACHTRHEWARSSGQRLSSTDSGILAHLDRDRPAAPSVLARHLGVGRPTLSAALRRLEELGFVTRERDPANRRRLQVRLTERGVAAMQASSVLETDRLARVLRRLRPEERRRAVDGLSLLARSAREVMERDRERRGRW